MLAVVAISVNPPLACHRIDVWECDRPICTALIELRPVENSWPCPWCEQAVGTHRTATWCLHANHKVAEGLGEPCPCRLSCARGPLHGCRQAADAGSSHGLRVRPLGGLETQGRDVLTALARALDRLANCLRETQSFNGLVAATHYSLGWRDATVEEYGAGHRCSSAC